MNPPTSRLPLGLNFISSVPLTSDAAQNWYSDAIALSVQADREGWSHVKTVEHYLYDWGGATPNPCLLLSAIAARTQHVRVVTGAVLPVFHHPMQLAAELAMLDQISGGRLDAGFARGFLPGEFELFEVPMAESRARFDEGIAQITQLWTQDIVHHTGHFHRLEGATLRPPPRQSPHPPIFVAAVSTPISFERAGAAGHHLMVVPTTSLDKLADRVSSYRSARENAGYAAHTGRIQVSVQALASDAGIDHALDAVRGPYRQYQQLLARAVSDPSRIDAATYPGYDKMLAAINASQPEQALDFGGLLCGNADTIGRQVSRIRDALGPVELSVQVNFGGIPLERARHTLSTLTHVMRASLLAEESQ